MRKIKFEIDVVEYKLNVNTDPQVTLGFPGIYKQYRLVGTEVTRSSLE